MLGSMQRLHPKTPGLIMPVGDICRHRMKHSPKQRTLSDRIPDQTLAALGALGENRSRLLGLRQVPPRRYVAERNQLQIATSHRRPNYSQPFTRRLAIGRGRLFKDWSRYVG